MHVISWYAHIVRYLLKTVNCQNARCVLVRKFSTIVTKKKTTKKCDVKKIYALPLKICQHIHFWY